MEIILVGLPNVYKTTAKNSTYCAIVSNICLYFNSNECLSITKAGVMGIDHICLPVWYLDLKIDRCFSQNKEYGGEISPPHLSVFP